MLILKYYYKYKNSDLHYETIISYYISLFKKKTLNIVFFWLNKLCLKIIGFIIVKLSSNTISLFGYINMYNMYNMYINTM